MIGTVAREFRQALRVLRRRPGFAAVAVLTLALGIGANTAVFSVFHSVVLRPLPYPDPDGLVALDETFEGVAGYADGTPVWSSYRSFLTWRDESRSFEGIAATRSGRSTLEFGSEPRMVTSARVTANYFSILGVEPVMGRSFTEKETVGAAAPVVILSEGLWRQGFAADPDIIGRSLHVDGASKLVVGVMPNGQRDVYTGARQLWTPLYLDEGRWLNSDARFLRLIGRLSPGRTPRDATRELVDLQARLAADYPDTHASKGAVVRPLHGVLVRNVDGRLRLLLGAVGLVLVIATINVGGLMVARFLERSDEWRVRMALGAGGRRLLGTSVVESLTLACLGGLAGIGIAQLGVGVLTRIEGGTLPAGSSVSIDGVVLAYAAAISLAAGLVFAVAPVWTHSRRPTKGFHRAGPSFGRAREALVVTEGALAVVVLVALGLALRSYSTLLDEDPGFDPDRMVTFRTPLPEARYPSAEEERAFHSALRSALLATPGVEAVGAMDALPLERGAIWPAFIDGQPIPPPGQEPQVHHRFVTPGAFSSLDVDVISGRDFTEAEFAEAADVIVVDEQFAHRFWPGEDPIGRQVRHFRDGPWLRVVGLVGSTAQGGLESGFLPTTYAPRTEDEMHVVVRSRLALDELLPALRRGAATVDPGVPVDEVRPGSMVVAGDVADRRFDWLLLLAFATVGLTLAAIGTYGSLSALVLQRRREIGVRRALGESAHGVVGGVLRRTLRLALLGVVVGGGLSLALSSVMDRFVYAVPATDPVTYGAVAVLMLAAGLAAGLVPALRAAAISPMDAIRGDGR